MMKKHEVFVHCALTDTVALVAADQRVAGVAGRAGADSPASDTITLSIGATQTQTARVSRWRESGGKRGGGSKGWKNTCTTVREMV